MSARADLLALLKEARNWIYELTLSCDLTTKLDVAISELEAAPERKFEPGFVIIPCKLCVDPGDRYSRWLFFPHPDGQYVTAFKVTEEQSEMLGHWHRQQPRSEAK